MNTGSAGLLFVASGGSGWQKEPKRVDLGTNLALVTYAPALGICLCSLAPAACADEQETIRPCGACLDFL